MWVEKGGLGGEEWEQKECERETVWAVSVEYLLRVAMSRCTQSMLTGGVGRRCEEKYRVVSGRDRSPSRGVGTDSLSPRLG